MSWLNNFESNLPSLGVNVEERLFKGYTPSGNRKYAPLTLENVVKEMKGGANTEGWNYGVGNIRALVTPKFKNLKDKLKENQLTWSDVVQVQKTIFDYLNKFTFDNSQKKESFPLPLDLLDQYVEYQEKKYDETFFRVILYWLEKLKKIKL